MDFVDKEIICRDCGTAFMWSAGEQEFFAQKGLTNTPSRCPICRKKKDVKHQFQHSFDIKCSACGKTSKSPFEPADPQGVLCQDCWAKKNDDVDKSSMQIKDASTMESQY